MTGRQHYRKAEEHLEVARKADVGSKGERYNLAAAQAHATLALASVALSRQLPACGVPGWDDPLPGEQSR